MKEKKRPVRLIVLFALSLGSSIAQLWRLSERWNGLEEQVSNSLKNLYKQIQLHPELEEVPEWLGAGVIESARHFQDYGVAFYELKCMVYFLTTAAVVLMFVWKRSGFYLYIAAQCLTTAAVLYGLGINAVSIIAASLTGLIALLFIWLYKRWFLNLLNE